MNVFPPRTALEKEFAVLVEDENMHGSVAQFFAMHFAARTLPDDAIVLIHNVKYLAR